MLFRLAGNHCVGHHAHLCLSSWILSPRPPSARKASRRPKAEAVRARCVRTSNSLFSTCVWGGGWVG